MESAGTNCILPDDLFEGILSRLAVRDLLRFRCVSKSWRALIDDSTFIWTQHRVQYDMCKANGDVPLLLWKRFRLAADPSQRCYLLSKQQGDDIVLNLTSDVERDRISVFTVDPDIRVDAACRGSANGIICLEIQCINQEYKRVESCCGLWNPATRDFKIIAYPDAPDHDLELGRLSNVVGFMFDSMCNDFKIVITTCIVSDKMKAYDIYSLSTNSWKRLEQPLLLGCLGNVKTSTMDACLNGVYYWTAFAIRRHRPPILDQWRYWILSFNLSTEVFRFSDPPQGAVPPLDAMPDEFMWEIGLYKECLALYITRRVPGEAVASFDIWVVTEFDDDFGDPLA